MEELFSSLVLRMNEDSSVPHMENWNMPKKMPVNVPIDSLGGLLSEAACTVAEVVMYVPSPTHIIEADTPTRMADG